MYLTRLEVPYAVTAGTLLLERVHQSRIEIPDELNQYIKNIDLLTTKLEQIRTPPDGPTARQLDYALDNMVTLIATTCHAVINCYESSPLALDQTAHLRLEDARMVQRSLFNAGIKAVIHLNYVQEWEQVAELRREMKVNRDVQSAFERLGLSSDFVMLERLHDQYSQRLGITVDSKRPPEAVLDEWYHAYDELAIAALYYGRKDPELRELIMGPYDEQVARQIRARTTHRIQQ